MLGTFNDIVEDIPSDYNPINDKDDYMNQRHLAYFKKILENERDRLKKSIEPRLNSMSEFDTFSGDDGDQVNNETQRISNIRLTDRSGKLLKKIEQALIRIENGEYGYSELSGEEIGIHRLMARPMATMTVTEQEKKDSEEEIHERYEETSYILEEDAPEVD